MKLAFGVAACVSLVACGSPDGASPAPGTPPDDAAFQAEVGRVTAELGEATCATTAPDLVKPVDDPQVESTGGAYDHPTCRDAFVIDAPGVLASQRIYMEAIVPVTPNVLVNVFGCYFHASWLYVYEKQGNAYNLLSQQFVTGSIQGQLPLANCHAALTFDPPHDGDYRVIAAARQILGPKDDVSVLIQAKP
jgi:hypothetical protein